MNNLLKQSFKFKDIVRTNKPIQVTSVEQAIYLLLHVYKDKFTNVEASFAVILGDNNILLELIFDTKGTPTSTMFHYKQIALRANKIGGKKIIIVHTHPNSPIIASDKDISSVKLIKSYFAEWGIRLLDSCIVDKENRFYSMTAKKIVDIKNRQLNKVTFKSICNINILSKLLNKDKNIKNLIFELNFPLKWNSENYISI